MTEAGEVTFPRLVRSDRIKFRSLRSRGYALGAAAAAMVVLGLVIGHEIGANPANLDVEPSATLQRYALAQLLNCSSACSACSARSSSAANMAPA
jgi:hypothetical protein